MTSKKVEETNFI